MKKIINSKIFNICLTLVAALCAYFFLPQDLEEPARRMAAIFIIAAFFWALEVVPLYATSLVVVLLQVLLLCRPDGIMKMNSSGYEVFLLPFGSPIIMLFFGGLTMAAAMQKYQLDKLIAGKLLKLFGTSPYFIMLGFMSATAFLSMWMSNTATTAMMMAMALPLVKQIKEGDPFRIGLLLSIPFAANIGGIATPVGTPPNAIALGILLNKGITLSFTSWMVMAVPLAVILLFGISILLFFMYKPQNKSIILEIDKNFVISRQMIMVGVIALITIGMWLTSSFHKIPSAITALLAVGMFFSFHLLNKDDLKHIEWDVLVLMWGGLSLGKGLELTGLTNWIIHLPIFSQQGGVLLVILFCFLAVLLSTFMSNTATANLLIPIVMVIPGENNLLLAIAVALSCSFAMALPISTPPNAIAFASNLINVRDMMKAGVIISLVAVIVLLLGYEIIIPRILSL